jgi:hypothetical protein
MLQAASGLSKRAVVLSPAQSSITASPANPGVVTDPGKNRLLKDPLPADPAPILMPASTCFAHPILLSRAWEFAQGNSWIIYFSKLFRPIMDDVLGYEQLA